jgi:hypothetical protein
MRTVPIRKHLGVTDTGLLRLWADDVLGPFFGR